MKNRLKEKRIFIRPALGRGRTVWGAGVSGGSGRRPPQPPAGRRSTESGPRRPDGGKDGVHNHLPGDVRFRHDRAPSLHDNISCIRACLASPRACLGGVFSALTALKILTIRQILHGRIERPCRIIVHDPSMGSLHDMDACGFLPCRAKNPLANPNTLRY